MTARVLPSRYSLLVDVGCLGVLLLASWKLVHGIEQVLDLGMWDEADYLRRGLTLSWSALPNAEWGPLYSIWYWALSRLWADPVAVYYANHKLLLLLTVAGSYAFMRRMGARSTLALLGSAIYLLSAAPHTLPRPTLLSLLVLLAAGLIASFLKSMEGFWAVVAGGLLLASFSRPEFFVAFLLATGVFVFLVGRKVINEGRSALPRATVPVAGFGLTTLVLLLVLGNPFGNTSNRRFYAFCQHFAVNYVARTQFPVDPWGECEQVIHSVFGNVDSVGAALRSNPEEFLWHLGVNLKRYVVVSVGLFFEGYGGTSAVAGAWTVERVGRLLLLVAVGWQLVMLAMRWRRFRAALAEPRLQRLIGVLLIVELPIVLSAILIQPRVHYLIIQGVMVAAVLATLGSLLGTWDEREPAERVLGVLLGLGLVVVTPDLSLRASPGNTDEHLRMVRTIGALGLMERMEPGKRLGMIEAQGGYDAYLGRRYRRVYLNAGKETFGEFLRKHDIGLILLDDALRKHPRFARDAEFLAFQSDPEAFGFSMHPLPGKGKALAIPSTWTTVSRANSYSD
ncbi:hypothetical protein F0U61_21980 [Archangium violaceum]|uniref:hypothetical protein n=1 Tax=Archangium violaceum TaxID=83451 RepID=UPI002B2A171D|nr:hypothetical protein F0U61_21980 [Archangium violaceum]